MDYTKLKNSREDIGSERVTMKEDLAWDYVKSVEQRIEEYYRGTNICTYTKLKKKKKKWMYQQLYLL